MRKRAVQATTLTVDKMLDCEKAKAPPSQLPRVDAALVTIGLLIVAVSIGFVWFALTASAPP
jgi:hypothetical protein